jgi:hypothetical protein
VLLSRRRPSCDELDTHVLTASGKPRSVRPRGRSVLSELFYPVFVLLRFVHSIVFLFFAPLSCNSLPLPLSYCARFSAKEHLLLTVVTAIGEESKRTRPSQRSSLFTAASRRGSDTRKTAGKHKTHRGPSQRPKKEMRRKGQPVVSFETRLERSYGKIYRLRPFIALALLHPSSRHCSRTQPPSRKQDFNREPPSVLERLGSHGGLQLQQQIKAHPSELGINRKIRIRDVSGSGPN